MAEGLRLATAALAPVMPGTCDKIYKLLGLSEVGLWKDD
jgi:methionyl-tRNA synthetase